MNDKDSIAKEEEEKKSKLMFPAGLTNFLRAMQERRQSPQERNWRQQHRRRGGLGGRGYTKGLRDEKKENIRRKIAKKSQKLNRRTKTTKSQRVIRRHKRKKK